MRVVKTFVVEDIDVTVYQHVPPENGFVIQCGRHTLGTALDFREASGLLGRCIMQALDTAGKLVQPFPP